VTRDVPRRRTNVLSRMKRIIRPSATSSTLALYAKSVLNACLFFAIFMVGLPWVACHLAPMSVPVPSWLRAPAGVTLGVIGIGVWLWCLDVFSRCGRPPDWNSTGAAGPDQETDDIRTIIQAIVRRLDWQAGNALAIIISGDTPDKANSRIAEAHDSGAAVAPVLRVEYH
jgi:hypothetical protein